MSSPNFHDTAACIFCGSNKHNYASCPIRGQLDSAPTPEMKSPTEEIDHDVLAQQDFRSWKKQIPWPLPDDYLSAAVEPLRFSLGALAMVAVTSFIVGCIISNSHLADLIARILTAGPY